MITSIRFIREQNDPIVSHVMSIYHDSFPDRERMSDAYFEKSLAKIAGGDNSLRFIVAESPDGKAVGFAYYEVGEYGQPAYLWYIAVLASYRNNSIGEMLYKSVAEDVLRDAPAFLFEVEDPTEVLHVAGEEDALIARRRLAWYRKLGAKSIHGVSYKTGTDIHPPMPFIPMIHSAVPCTPEQAIEWAYTAFGEDADLKIIDNVTLV